jgi:chromatin remodeling complex protein RSC6
MADIVEVVDQVVGEMESTVVSDLKLNVSASDNLKSVITMLHDHSSKTKALLNYMRAALREVERQTKDYDKLRNKHSRVKVERKNTGVQSGITKPVPISDELAVFLGVAPGTMVPRNEVTKGVSAYVRKNDLSDPANRQRFVLNSKPEGLVLKTLLGNPSEDVTYFNLQRYLKHHYILGAPVDSDVVPPVATPVVESVAPVTESVESDVRPVKDKQLKKKLVLKKKPEQLSEE